MIRTIKGTKMEMTFRVQFIFDIKTATIPAKYKNGAIKLPNIGSIKGKKIATSMVEIPTV